MKTRFKKLFCSVFVLILLLVFVTQVSAAMMTDKIFFFYGSGVGYLSCNTSAYYYDTTAYTHTTIHGDEDNDYIYVSISFTEYNSELDATFYNFANGPEHYSADVSGYAFNPHSVDGIHVLKRGDDVEVAATHIQIK